MSITTVLFDLDGTLLPMDQEAFVKAYFGGLTKKLAPLGYNPEDLVKAIWQGTKAMITNGGSETNEKVFWNTFAEIFGQRVREDEPVFEDFYKNEFSLVQKICGYTPAAAKAVEQLKSGGKRLVLATNPIFPSVATRSRIKWAGLRYEDFGYITTYENSHYCKPNIKYYEEILSALKLSPEECLMVGNDVTEDMVAERLGIKVFLLTDNLINKDNSDISRFPQGNFADLMLFIEEKVNKP